MRVYAYGARPPVEGAELVNQQFRLATVYQRVLVLLERRRRDVIDRLYRHACPAEWTAYEAASNACIAAAQAVRVSRSTAGGGDLEPDETGSAAAKQALTRARQYETETRQAWNHARKSATPRLRRRIKMVDNGVKARQKFAYNAAGNVGLAWGTRLKVGEAVERAAKASAAVGSMPHLPRYDGSGMVVVQLQGESGIGNKNGLAPKDALSGRDTRFRLEYVDRSTWAMLQGKNAHISKSGRPLPQPNPNSHRSRKRDAGYYAIAKLRVGSDGRAPVWAAWPVIVHRRIPENAPIKWAQIHARHIGARMEWQLLLTIDDDVPAIGECGHTLAVNLGWRTLSGGDLRVAYAVGSDGHEEEVRVPTAYVNGVGHVSSLKSIRDRLFVEAKKSIVEWADEQHNPPAWFVDELRYIGRWLAQRKLVRLIGAWRNRRFAGDQEMFEQLLAWQKKDRHLWFWECDEREKLLRMRRHVYRCIAAKWATKYAHIFVTDMDLRDFTELPSPEDGAKSDGKPQRVSQRLAAPSELRRAVRDACSSRGTCCPQRVMRNRKSLEENTCTGHVGVTERLKSPYKTQTCNACGVVFPFDAKQQIEHTCLCGARWDQDANHCRNLLASGEVMGRSRGPLAPSLTDQNKRGTERKGRWQKRRSQTGVQSVEVIGEKA